ncbi:hypothetical protein [Paenirhodobacter sp.]|uniref:hypothetical protein n=1 Tax=Paenirhodobacter sp. TaxID=1965326 RepID=UPI003B506760
MKTTILAALALTLLPALASAECPFKEKTAMSCPMGQSWDGHAQKCVATSS